MPCYKRRPEPIGVGEEWPPPANTERESRRAAPLAQTEREAQTGGGVDRPRLRGLLRNRLRGLSPEHQPGRY